MLQLAVLQQCWYCRKGFQTSSALKLLLQDDRGILASFLLETNKKFGSNFLTAKQGKGTQIPVEFLYVCVCVSQQAAVATGHNKGHQAVLGQKIIQFPRKNEEIVLLPAALLSSFSFFLYFCWQKKIRMPQRETRYEIQGCIQHSCYECKSTRNFEKQVISNRILQYCRKKCGCQVKILLSLSTHNVKIPNLLTYSLMVECLILYETNSL